MKKILAIGLATMLVGALGISALANECPGGGSGGTCPLPTKEPK